MNEELKIIISAVNTEAKKAIKEVNTQISGLSKSAGTTGSKVAAVFKGMGKTAAVAVAGVAAIAGALVALGKSTLEYQKEQAKLNAAFIAAGSSAAQAGETYNQLYRYLGDSSKATEAAAHLAKITTNQEDLAEWTKITQGIYATFGDSLPIEGLTEAANETIKVGKVTGGMADALNWAGVSEDAFNAALANTNSLAEREALTRNTLNNLYKNAAEIYEQNNKALLDYNESQAKLQATTGEIGKATLPLMTAFNNLGNALLTALKPALDFVIPVLASFVNMITNAISSVMSFFGALTGKSQSIKTVAQGVNTAASGSNNLASGLETAKEQAEALKRSTQGFDELNIVPSGAGAGASGGGGAAGAGAGGLGNVGGLGFTTEIVEGEEKANGFAQKIKKVFGEIKDYITTTFAPSISAWSGAFDTIAASWETAKSGFMNGAIEILNSFFTLGSYLVNEFVPSIVNSFSVNLAPLFGDVFGTTIEEASKMFEYFGGVVNNITNDMILPAFKFIETVITDVFTIVGEAWAAHGEPLLKNIGGFFESLRGHFDIFYSVIFKPIWDKVLATFDRVWKNGLKPLVNNFVNSALEIGNEILILYNKVIAPVVNWILKNIFPIIVDVIKKIMDIVGDFWIHISNTISGLITAIKGIVQFIVGVFTGDWEKAWNGIKNILDGIWKAITNIFKAAWEAIKLIFAPVGTFFSSTWNKIKEAFSAVGSWFKGIFQTAWNNIKGVFSGVKTFFKGVWNDIKAIFSNVGTTIAGAISGTVSKAINTVLSTATSIINGFISSINFAIGIINEIPGVSISKLKKLSVPKLAKGGIVDSATLAVIGERGKEAVMPLENNTEWMDKLADRLAERTNAPSKIVLNVDGKELGWANIRSINNITRQTGTLQLVLA